MRGLTDTVFKKKYFKRRDPAGPRTQHVLPTTGRRRRHGCNTGSWPATGFLYPVVMQRRSARGKKKKQHNGPPQR